MKSKYFINKILNIKYINKNNEIQDKQITIDVNIVSRDQCKDVNMLKQTLESDLIIIFSNDNYTNNYYEKKYKNIIQSNITDIKSLVYATQYYYLDSYPDNLF